jgi:hypothetical protein
VFFDLNWYDQCMKKQPGFHEISTAEAFQGEENATTMATNL